MAGAGGLPFSPRTGRPLSPAEQRQRPRRGRHRCAPPLLPKLPPCGPWRSVVGAHSSRTGDLRGRARGLALGLQDRGWKRLDRPRGRCSDAMLKKCGGAWARVSARLGPGGRPSRRRAPAPAAAASRAFPPPDGRAECARMDRPWAQCLAFVLVYTRFLCYLFLCPTKGLGLCLCPFGACKPRGTRGCSELSCVGPARY